jgi:adenylate cyclase class 2
MEKERELTVLEINLDNFIKCLEELGAEKKGEFLQRRYVFDVKPVNPKKWIRLRTNGTKSTLTIKEIKDKTAIDGTEELEIIVNNFDKTKEILNELGYESRNYQENYRRIYLLNNTEISVDSWPLIPTYAEIEGKTNEDVQNVLELVNTENYKVTTLDVDSIYREIYGIDIKKIKELKLGE